MKRNLSPCLESLEGKQLMTVVPALSYALSAVPVQVSGRQEIELMLTIKNMSTQPVTVPLGPSFDGFVAKQNGQAVWQSNTGIQPFYASIVSLAPGRSTQVTTFWNETSNVGAKKAGTAITGAVTFDDQLAPAVTATTTIPSPPTPRSIYYPLLATAKK